MSRSFHRAMLIYSFAWDGEAASRRQIREVAERVLI